VPLQKWGGTFSFKGGKRMKYILPKPSAQKTEPTPEELEQVKAMFKQVMSHGMEFRPWLVAVDGEVVGQVPDKLDGYLMQCHRYYKDSQHEVFAPDPAA
jgi:hypothetical protein